MCRTAFELTETLKPHEWPKGCNSSQDQQRKQRTIQPPLLWVRTRTIVGQYMKHSAIQVLVRAWILASTQSCDLQPAENVWQLLEHNTRIPRMEGFKSSLYKKVGAAVKPHSGRIEKNRSQTKNGQNYWPCQDIEQEQGLQGLKIQSLRVSTQK